MTEDEISSIRKGDVLLWTNRLYIVFQVNESRSLFSTLPLQSEEDLNGPHFWYAEALSDRTWKFFLRADPGEEIK